MGLHVTHAISARTYVEAFGGATLAQLAKHNGRQPVMVEVQVAVSKAMLAYAPARRMGNDQIVMFAEGMMEDFCNESLADLRLFARHVASASYDRGETYGAIDVPMLRRWWGQYLADKAEALEARRRADNDRMNPEWSKHAEGVDPRTLEAMKAGAEIGKAAKEQDETDTAKELSMLREALPTMDVEELRKAYRTAKTTGRSLIMAEAKRRGHMGEAAQMAQVAWDRREADRAARAEIAKAEEAKAAKETQVALFREMEVPGYRAETSQQ